MAWQANRAQQDGMDTLWWSEHDHAFDHDHIWSKTWNPPERVEDAVLVLAPQTQGGAARTYPFLAAQPRLTLRYRRGMMRPGDRLRIHFNLSWHRAADGSAKRHVYEVFLVHAEGGGPPVTLSEGRVRQRIGAPPKGQITIPVFPDAADPNQPPLSLDNVLGNIRVIASGNAWIEISEATVHCGITDRQILYQQLKSISEENSAVSGLRQFYSLEHTVIFGPHCNAYLPDGDVVPEERLSDPEMAAQIHAKGGLLSLNHPFGTALWSARRHGETEESWVRNYADVLLQADVFSGDLMEVGYLDGRGGVSGQGHMLLWDLLLANRAFLPNPRTILGVGVSDTHGEADGRAPTGGSMCTWLLPDGGAQPSRAQAVELMRTGRMFFGNYRAVHTSAVFDFSLGPLRMGEEGDPGTDTSELLYTIEPRPEGAVVFLRETPILTEGPDFALELPAAVELGGGAASVETPPGTAKAIRLELRASSGELIAATNPIIVVRAPGGEPAGEPPPVDVTPTPEATPETTPEDPAQPVDELLPLDRE